MSVLKYFIAIAVAVFFGSDFSSAQSFSLYPNDTLQLKGVLEDVQTLSIAQMNDSQDTITLKWQKISASVPAGWEATVCDNSVCHEDLGDTGTMFRLFPGDLGFILLHITPHQKIGTAIVRYTVWDVNTPQKKDTLTYILTVETATAINEPEIKNALSIYPVPAGKQLNITSAFPLGFTYSVVDFSGKIILSGVSNSGSASISTEKIANGIYSILISDKKEIFLVKKITVQH
jgi:hypothetical protein